MGVCVHLRVGLLLDRHRLLAEHERPLSRAGWISATLLKSVTPPGSKAADKALTGQCREGL